MAVRSGFAHVAGLYPSSATFLVDGLTYGKAIGFTTMKVYLSPSYATDYPGQTWAGSYSSLAGLCQDPAFATVFNDSQITRYFITAFTFANGVNNKWRVSNAPSQGGADLAAEASEIQALVEQLKTSYPTKEFILQNWEGDWALIGATSSTQLVEPYSPERMIAFLNARQAGITRGRAGAAKPILHAVECNRVLDDNNRRVHRDVLPYVKPDIVSFSSYEAINTWGTGQVDAEANIQTLLTRCVQRIRDVLPDTRIVVGEFGWPEADSTFISLGLNVGQLIAKFNTVANSLGITDTVYWQIFDNDGRHYCLYLPGLTLSGAGTYYDGIL